MIELVSPAEQAGTRQENTARFCALGPLEVLDLAGTAVFIGQRKKRRLLSMLLLRAGRWVSTEQLATALWEDDPPRSALGNIKTYVSDLRHALPPPPPLPAAGRGRDDVASPHAHTGAPSGPVRIVGRGGEYRIQLWPGELDIELFDTAARAGETELAAGRPGRAATLLEQALLLWRGRPYEDIPADLAVSETTRLEELRWAVWENLVDARLRLGQHDRVLPALRALTLEHPTRERLWAQLLVALDQDGRRAEALNAYQTVYHALTERLGIEPGEDLRRAHQRILAGTHPAAGTAPASARPAATGRPGMTAGQTRPAGAPVTGGPAGGPGRAGATAGAPVTGGTAGTDRAVRANRVTRTPAPPDAHRAEPRLNLAREEPPRPPGRRPGAGVAERPLPGRDRHPAPGAV
ncbi:MAG: AfsR/SARP family transcriptional regulator [Frankia sp.]|nr:AfsR/SARP family transcriptional regulator [Frankia sp.]